MHNARPAKPKASTGSKMAAKLKMVHTPVSHAFRHIEPHWRNYIDYVKAAAEAGDDDMKKFMESYNALPPRERNTVMPDTVCDLSGVAASEVVGAVAKQLWNMKSSESVITASMNHPKVMEHTARNAGHILGHKDRELFFRVTGTLPDKKGASIVIHNAAQNNANLPQHSSAGANGYKPMDLRVIEMGKLLDEPDEANIIHTPPYSERETADVLEDSD